MILTEYTVNDLLAIAKELKSAPVVKIVSKTKSNNLYDIEFTEDQTKDMFRLCKRILRNPAANKFINLTANSMTIINQPYRHSLAGGYAWFIKDILAALSKATSARQISAEAKKFLVAWMDNNTMSATLPSHIADEIKAVPGIRPDSPVLLYRGLLFSDHNFKDDRAQFPMGAHRKVFQFLDAIKAGKNNLMMEYPKASSWTTSYDIASRFATSRAATSHHGAMSNWIQSVKTGAKIQGRLGIIISTLARPDDIIVDLNKINVHGQHGSESEIILDKGKHRVRMVTLFTRDGEIDIEKYQQMISKGDQ